MSKNKAFPKVPKDPEVGRGSAKRDMDKNALGTRFLDGSDFVISLFLVKLSSRPSHEDFFKISPMDLKRTRISA